MRYLFTTYLLVFTFFFSPNFVRAQKIDPLILKNIDKKIIHSKVLNQKRKIFIYKPKTDIYSDAPLPVLYMVDGESIAKVAAIVDSSINNGDFPPMIIVGIANYKDARTNDLTPVRLTTNQNGITEKSGGGELFLKFVKDEVIPFVNNEYKTSNEKILFGHSLGGLLSVYSLMMYPEVFMGYSNEHKGTKNYGLGIRMIDWETGQHFYFHNGWWHGNTSSYITLQKENVVIIALSNQFTTLTYKVRELSTLFGDYPFKIDNDEKLE